MRTDRGTGGSRQREQGGAPAISVIVPHLNQSEALGRCLTSLEQQDFPRELFEVIVVDNGSSTPPTAPNDTCPGMRLAFEETPGPGPARNRGAALARGDILAFIDADCVAHRDWLGTIYRRFEDSDPAILGGDVRIARRHPRRLMALEAYESVFAYRQREYIERHGFSGTGNLSVRRRDFERIGPFPGIDEAEDVVWGRRAGALGYRIEYMPGMIVFHPARASFAELAAKWNRHVRHEYAQWMRSGRGRLVWLLRSLAIAASAVTDSRKILASRRISGAGARLGGVAVLARIRLYRARRMVRFACRPPEPDQALGWNRPVGHMTSPESRP